MNKKLLKKLAGKKPKAWPRMVQPDGVRRNYFNAIRRGPLADAKRLVDELLKPKLEALAQEANPGLKLDGAAERLGQILGDIRERFAEKWTREKFAKVARNGANEAQRFHRQGFNAAAKKAFGVDVIGNEPWLAKALDVFVKENVSLITSIPETYFDQVEARVSEALTNGARASTMVDELQERYGVSESRANLIARDQIGKLNGDLNQLRLKDLGVERYVWRTMRDNRVRESHEEREGQTYRWDDPPGDPSDPASFGNPGEPISCRCFSDPIFDDLT